MPPVPSFHRRHLIAITVAALAVPLGATAQHKVFNAGAATSNITPVLDIEGSCDESESVLKAVQ